MSECAFIESDVEEAALAWLAGVGWAVRNGAEIAPGAPAAERDDYGEMVLVQRLRARLPPGHISGELRVSDTERFLEANA